MSIVCLQFGADVRDALVSVLGQDASRASPRPWRPGPPAASTNSVELRVLGGGDAGATAEHVDVEQRVGAETVRAVHRDAGALAGGVQAGDDLVVVAQHLTVDLGGDAAHDVVAGREDRHAAP